MRGLAYLPGTVVLSSLRGSNALPLPGPKTTSSNGTRLLLVLQQIPGRVIPGGCCC